LDVCSPRPRFSLPPWKRNSPIDNVKSNTWIHEKLRPKSHSAKAEFLNYPAPISNSLNYPSGAFWHAAFTETRTVCPADVGPSAHDYSAQVPSYSGVYYTRSPRNISSKLPAFSRLNFQRCTQRGALTGPWIPG
jgi:hypothetical protein